MPGLDLEDHVSMTPGIDATRPTPSAFISYSWDSDEHRTWVRDFATRLRANGVNVVLDQWDVQPGDQLPAFMERAVRENDYVIIICTPSYAERSNQRRGGVGYEGDIMSGEVLTNQNQRKFIPIFRDGNQWQTAAPTWLQGKYYIDLRGNPYDEDRYQDLLTTLHGLRPTRPPLGERRAARPVEPYTPAVPELPIEPIRIMGVIVDEVTVPRRDGTVGSALYRIPFQLNRPPGAAWAELFIQHWNRPSRFTSRHRPGIAYVADDRIYLDGTTMEEVERYHRDTLVLAIRETNDDIAEREEQERAAAERRRQQQEEHARAVRDAAQRINFS